MLQITDDEILALLRSNETDRVERKERLAGDASSKIREAICAFANDLAGHAAPGVVIVGMTDDGRHAGTTVDDRLLLDLGAMREDGHILPVPTMGVERRVLDGNEYAVIVVAPADAPPVRYKGRIWIRVGPRRAIASAQDERILNERRKHHDLPFDLQPIPTATIDDLRRRLFEEDYLPSAFAPDVVAANERSYEQRLAALKMIVSVDDTTPTLLGLLALSSRPRDFVANAYIQFLRIAGGGLADPIQDEEAIDGSIAEVISRADAKIRAHVRVAVDLTSSATEQRTADYPVAAIDQIVRNAVMHRTYEGTNTPIRITWLEDRIEISSPGGPYGLVTQQNFGRPGVTDYRNPHIADAMRTLGFVQRFGVGIASAQRALSENGNPPLEWEIDERFVLARLRRRP